METVTDYYRVLDVSATAGADELKAAYRRQAMQCHPERGGSHQSMVMVAEAGSVLCNAGRRAAYDRILWSTLGGLGGGDQAAAQHQWNALRSEAQAEAQAYPRQWNEFERGIDRPADKVKNSPVGRAAAGALVGAMIAAPVGAVACWYMELDLYVGAVVGAVAGAICGAITAARNASVVS